MDYINFIENILHIKLSISQKALLAKYDWFQQHKNDNCYDLFDARIPILNELYYLTYRGHRISKIF